MSRTARLCWFIDRNQWINTMMALAGSLLFIVGCIFFYFESLYLHGITLFLVGSVCMLLDVLAAAVWRHGPSR